ncbi:MAG: hypothetical protein K0S76_2137 [Herbinix sp.]|nr:hypothetical protein [Herbinix sp.]
MLRIITGMALLLIISFNRSGISIINYLDSNNTPPKLTITVGETEIIHGVNLIDWNGSSKKNNDFTSLILSQKELPVFESPEGVLFKDNINLDFGDNTPDSITVNDDLITKNGYLVHSRITVKRDVIAVEEGKYSFGLNQHFALMLSSHSDTYTNPSYRGFTITCTFGQNKCEYLFVIKLGPAWK